MTYNMDGFLNTYVLVPENSTIECRSWPRSDSSLDFTQANFSGQGILYLMYYFRNADIQGGLWPQGNTHYLLVNALSKHNETRQNICLWLSRIQSSYLGI